MMTCDTVSVYVKNESPAVTYTNYDVHVKVSDMGGRERINDSLVPWPFPAFQCCTLRRATLKSREWA